VYIAIAWLMIWINLRSLGVRHAASIDSAAPAPRKRTRTTPTWCRSSRCS